MFAFLRLLLQVLFSELNINCVFYLLFYSVHVGQACDRKDQQRQGFPVLERLSDHDLSQNRKCHRITEWVRLVGRDLQRSSGLTSLVKQGHLESVAQDYVQTAFEYLQGWRAHKPSGKPVPVLIHPHSESFSFCSFFSVCSSPPYRRGAKNIQLITTCIENPAILRIFNSLFLLSSSKCV